LPAGILRHLPHEGHREKAMANPFEFLQQVRAEASKVTWPTRRETMVSTGLVILMVIVASIFFVAVDWTIKNVLGFILTIGK
jgi:preprotein translocase subunit SecE